MRTLPWCAARDTAVTTLDGEALRLLDEAARSAGQRSLTVVLGDTAHTILTQGDPGAVLLDLDAADVFAALDRERVFEPPGLAAMLPLAHAAAALGVELRRSGDVAKAVCVQRLAVWIVLRLGDAGDTGGIGVTVGNLWSARQAIADAMVRGLTPAISGADRARFEATVRAADTLLRRDAGSLAAAMRAFLDTTAAAPAAPVWLAAHRLAQIAGERDLASRADAALSEPTTQEGSAARLTARLDQVADWRIGTVLDVAGVVPAAASSSGTAGALVDYLRQRDAVLAADEPPADNALLQAMQAAFDQLAFLRLATTAAGGAFGHRLSYAVAPWMNELGRDVAMVYTRRGQLGPGLRTIESVLARSMGDWMGRTHGLRAISERFRSPFHPLTGSVNGCEPADLAEIVGAAAQAGPLLYLAQLPNGASAWLVDRNGGALHAALGDLAPLLAECAAVFPHVARRGALRHLGAGPSPAAGVDQRHDLLRRIDAAIFPQPIRDALAGDAGERLVILADSAFNTVPFAALRDAQGRHLIERRAIEVWPSVTARLAIRTGAQRPTWARAKAAGPVAPLVMGLGRFGGSGHGDVQLDDLPGAASEATAVGERMGVAPRLDADATLQRLLDDGNGAEVVHLATHCLLDEAAPEHSFVVLSDGHLTAGELYRLDRGLRVGLVVLSACQTGLGGAHPDSIIGLTNALLIAGAQCVVSTLWKIPDRESATLVQRFYAALDGRTSVAAALREAQLAMLRSPDTADPFYWAAFRATGAASRLQGEVAIVEPGTSGVQTAMGEAPRA